MHNRVLYKCISRSSYPKIVIIYAQHLCTNLPSLMHKLTTLLVHRHLMKHQHNALLVLVALEYKLLSDQRSCLFKPTKKHVMQHQYMYTYIFALFLYYKIFHIILVCKK